MCGIFGYIGNKGKGSLYVFEGLKTLEYRGYDSWGVAVVDKKGKLQIEKYTGKMADSPQFNLARTSSSLAIGHTRWATHGGVTVENAHPHVDCTKQIAVVHNGIVENYKTLKNELLKRDHTFLSDTDTEVIAHLIEEKRKKLPFPPAVREAFLELEGLSALVVLDHTTNMLVAAKNGSPLIIGMSDDDYFIASDMAAILPHTNKMVFLKDQEMAILEGKPQIISIPTGEKKDINVETISWKHEAVSRGKHSHFMMKEISEQPQVIRGIVEGSKEQIETLSHLVKKAKDAYFIASGTAYHAGLTGVYLLSKVAGAHVDIAIASEFTVLEKFLSPKSLVIALSQSGETIDVIEPLTRAQEKKSTIVAITNTLGSTIYRMADHKMLLQAGPEKAVASTKAYTAKLTILLLLSYALIKKTNEISPLLLEAADEIEEMLEKKNIKNIQKLAKKLSKAPHIFTIGRGVSYPTALEAALKIKEVSYLLTEGLPGGELKHGPIALIEKGVPCIVFAPLDDTHSAMISNAIEIKSRGGYIIGVSPENSEAFDAWIEVKDLKDATVITQIVPLQLLAYFLALERGIKDPDKPRNLAKSVTVK